MTDDELKAAITTVEGGKLTVATSPDFAPYEFYAIDENGDPQLAGFDMDLAQYIADYLGLSLEIVPMDFDGTIMERRTATWTWAWPGTPRSQACRQHGLL
ncbi:MAG: transporter substrate-binding domain-containing protein [Dysosmobacter welbionis]